MVSIYDNNFDALIIRWGEAENSCIHYTNDENVSFILDQDRNIIGLQIEDFSFDYLSKIGIIPKIIPPTLR